MSQSFLASVPDYSTEYTRYDAHKRNQNKNLPSEKKERQICIQAKSANKTNEQQTKKKEHYTYHVRNNVLRASSPALRTTDDRPVPPVASAPAAPLVPPVGPPAAFALFAAAAARNRFAPLGRFTRVRVAPPARRGSRSTRRRNGLGRFSSSCKSYVGAAGCGLAALAAEVTVCVLLDEDEDEEEDDDDDDEMEEDGGGAGMAEEEEDVGALTVREDTDGRRRRLTR